MAIDSHEIDRPTVVRQFWNAQWLWVSAWQPLLSLSPQVEFEQAVHAVNSLMVPDVPLASQNFE